MFNDLRQYYNPNACEYFNCTYTIDLTDIYKKIISHFDNKNSLLLDVGAGSCRDSKYLASVGYNVVSFDLAVELLKLAAKEYSGKFCNGDMIFLPFKNCIFDYALANASLLHIAKAQALKVLLEIRRVLKKTGKLYISVKKGEGEGYDERGRFFAYYSEAEIANILNHADYKIIECSVDESADNRNIKWIYAIAQKI